MFPQSRKIALSVLSLLSACASADGTLERSAAQTGRLEASRQLPDYPQDCRTKETSGVRVGEPLDVALLRTDQALGRANARLARCGRWYDGIRTGYARRERD
ncbi:MAG: hypothetical protein Tsb0019_01280 [Roseibium sp.]